MNGISAFRRSFSCKKNKKMICKALNIQYPVRDMMEDIILDRLFLLILISRPHRLQDFFKIKPAQFTVIVIIHRQDTTILIMDIFLFLNGRHYLGSFLN